MSRDAVCRSETSFGHDGQFTSKQAHVADELVTTHSRSQWARAFPPEAALSAEATHPHLTHPWSVGGDHAIGSPAHHPQHQHAEPQASPVDHHRSFKDDASHARPTAASSRHSPPSSRGHGSSHRPQHHQKHSPDSSSASHLNTPAGVTAVASRFHDDGIVQQQHGASDDNSSSSSGRSSTSGSHSFGSDPHVSSQLDGLRRRSALRKSR